MKCKLSWNSVKLETYQNGGQWSSNGMFPWRICSLWSCCGWGKGLEFSGSSHQSVCVGRDNSFESSMSMPHGVHAHWFENSGFSTSIYAVGFYVAMCPKSTDIRANRRNFKDVERRHSQTIFWRINAICNLTWGRLVIKSFSHLVKSFILPLYTFLKK